MDVVFFDSSADFRAWLEAHHASATELWVGFYRKDSGKRGISYPEAVDQALCFGWIDGVRRGVDATSYTNRFSPRKLGSNWSAVNIKRVGELSALGLMHAAGVKAFEARDPARVQELSSEGRAIELDGEYAERLRAHPEASAFFHAQSPWYRRTASWWVVSAKKEETRLKRLAALIEDSAAGLWVGPLRRGQRRPGSTD
jgi:uncharacterized protein YdeI (YjbR/CyaY-like superfamily)